MSAKNAGKTIHTPEEIESIYFEYRKIEALMLIGVGIRVSDFRFALNPIVQNYVNSRLLIDLFAVLDKAADLMFRKFRLKSTVGKSSLTILNEAGEVHSYPYLTWYKQWRNNAAHHFARTEYHELRQASEDVQRQLFKWGLIREEYSVSPYSKEIKKNTFYYGSVIKSIDVLLFRITYQESIKDGIGPSCNYEQIVNLSIDEYYNKLRGLGTSP